MCSVICSNILSLHPLSALSAIANKIENLKADTRREKGSTGERERHARPLKIDEQFIPPIHSYSVLCNVLLMMKMC